MVGFSMAGGQVHTLIHLSEIVTICGAALGALIASSPKRVLVDMVRGLLGLVKGGNCSKKTYEEVFQLLYQLFCIGRKDGLLAVESALADPVTSPLTKYPRIANDHHLKDFISSALGSVCDGTDGARLQDLLETDIRVADDEHHAVVGAMNRVSDGLPGFGIVAAVLGIVVTMQAINGPVEIIGYKVGAALVGTFLGILLSYGIVAPLAGRLEAQGAAESALLKTITTAVVDFVSGSSPKAVMEKARRSVTSDCRPTQKELEDLMNSARQA